MWECEEGEHKWSFMYLFCEHTKGCSMLTPGGTKGPYGCQGSNPDQTSNIQAWVFLGSVFLKSRLLTWDHSIWY